MPSGKVCTWESGHKELKMSKRRPSYTSQFDKLTGNVPQNLWVWNVNSYDDIAPHSICWRALALIYNPSWWKQKSMQCWILCIGRSFCAVHAPPVMCLSDRFLSVLFFFVVFYYIFLACCFQCQDSLPLTTPLSFSPFVVTAFREIIVYYVLSAFIVHQSFLLLSVKGLIQTNYFAI